MCAQAAWALGRIAPPDQAVADALIAAGDHEQEDEVLRTICETLVKVVQALKASHEATRDKTSRFLHKMRDSRASSIVRIQANMGLQDLHTDANADIPLVIEAPRSDWPALTDGDLCAKFKALHITRLAHCITQRQPEEWVSCRIIATELETYDFEESDETVRKCLIAVQELFRDHFKNPDFLLFDTSRRGIQFLPVDAGREHAIVWEFLNHLPGGAE